MYICAVKPVTLKTSSVYNILSVAALKMLSKVMCAPFSPSATSFCTLYSVNFLTTQQYRGKWSHTRTYNTQYTYNIHALHTPHIALHAVA